MRRFLLSPGEAFAAWAARPHPARLGTLAVAVQGLGWAALLAALAWRGHAPTRPGPVPIALEDYYAWEAAFVLPVRAAMALALALVVHALARRSGSGARFSCTWMLAAISLAVPSVCAWLIPDAIVFATRGFDALAPAMRYYVPVSLTWTLVLVVAGLREVHGLGTGRAIAIAIAGLIAQAAVGAPLLR